MSFHPRTANFRACASEGTYCTRTNRGPKLHLSTDPAIGQFINVRSTHRCIHRSVLEISQHKRSTDVPVVMKITVAPKVKKFRHQHDDRDGLELPGDLRPRRLPSRTPELPFLDQRMRKQEQDPCLHLQM